MEPNLAADRPNWGKLANNDKKIFKNLLKLISKLTCGISVSIGANVGVMTGSLNVELSQLFNNFRYVWFDI